VHTAERVTQPRADAEPAEIAESNAHLPVISASLRLSVEMEYDSFASNSRVRVLQGAVSSFGVYIPGTSRGASYFPAPTLRSICSMALAKSAGVRMTNVFPFTFAVARVMLSGKLGPPRK
jgi:hypothetical protein